MRKFIKFDDGEIVELSPITYKEFMAIDIWNGGSDIAYDEWLRKNGYVEADQYRIEALTTAKFIIVFEPISPEKFLFSSEPDIWKPYTYNNGNYAYYLKSQD